MEAVEIDSNSTEAQQAIALLEQMAAMAGGTGKRKAATGEAKDDGDRAGVWQPDLRYRSLVERLPVVTFMASLDERMQELYVSPQIETLLGFTQEEWLDNPILWFRQLHPEDRERWVTEFSRTCATGANFKAEYRLLARDGHIVWVQGECQVIRDDDGRPMFLQGIAFDITHLKKAGEVEEAKLAAEAANRAKSEFLARMSHEIRTPLNGVVGMIDLLLSTGMTENQQRYANLAREAADSLMSVINDILDFSKIEAGKVEIEAVEFDLHKVIEDLTELLAPMAAKKDVALACLLRPEVPRRALGDPGRIRQVLTNLINNALKFTSRGSVSVRATLDTQDEKSHTIKILVEDTGIGIPADRLHRLFKSFSQVDSSTTRKYGGTGLGLAISKRLVELMGGEISIDSTVGVGTKFWFTIKLGVSSNIYDGGPAEMLRKMRILAVETHPTYRRILSEQIEGLLAPASTVVDAPQAVSMLLGAGAENNPFAVALLPYGTPESEALRLKIQADPKLKHLKLIAIVDIDSVVETSELEKAGFSSGLHRPLTQSRFMDAIAEATVQRTESLANSGTVAAEVKDSLAGLHLLVAEDNEMNQFVTRETLKRAGCTCDIVSDGKLALEASDKKQYDAILMDCQMPVMDGLEATGRIRQREEANSLPHIPIIALTAEAIAGDREKCINAGMDDYVTKPINALDLFAAIAALVHTVQPSLVPKRPQPISVITPAAPAPELPIDVPTLLGRCMKDAEFAIGTLEKFRDRALGDVELLQRLLAAADGQSINRLAHNLKAAAAHVGAGPMRKIASDLEQTGAAFDASLVEKQLQELSTEVKRCAEFIPQAISELKEQGKAPCIS
jgi:PAS domain S-box-containing protein